MRRRYVNESKDKITILVPVEKYFFCVIVMQEHRKQAQVEDSWICTSTHFEDILKFKDETLM
jgi:hypothetical protein